MGKKADLEAIVKCCEVRFNRGSAVAWKHSDFSDLSREILRDTHVTISPNTLKRIFGKIAVDDEYLPQQATIDALKTYSRYQDKVAQDPEVEPIPVSSQPVVGVPPVSPASGNFKRHKWFLPLCIVVALTIGGLLIAKILRPKDQLSGRIVLKEIEGLLPATAFFDLKLPNSHDSLFVNFGDKSLLVYVTPEQKMVAHNYLFPGVFKVEVQTRKNVIAETRVSIRSDKWIGLGYRRQADLPERYYEFPAIKTGPDSLFHIANSQLYKLGLDTAGSYYTRLCNFTPVKNVSPDNFIFETTFKNKLHEKGIYCHSAQFQITGMDHMIRFKLVSPGCSFRIVNVVGEQIFEGTKTNLSRFAIDLENWNTAKLINRNKQVFLYVNDHLLYSGTYQKSLGELQGLFIEFEGNGYVKNCELKSLDGKILYQF